eukprot:CAMPEP_0114441054 /NCGR_PEP_ID=MMETSP0103-20121206/16143_1 /TAXON_ID=37642 ORGANISM="Paraphysomonas imperforata, Strain PA2" /NCGR_SAMPLE_ID=MMETSP0103 /ASSEMBLY_ACC=CAM_ASM_000201 /LENGTH=38 /DNA_ID= /DNA_START= /DNA_END= /DNA_ORIENTATION=
MNSISMERSLLRLLPGEKDPGDLLIFIASASAFGRELA